MIINIMEKSISLTIKIQSNTNKEFLESNCITIPAKHCDEIKYAKIGKYIFKTIDNQSTNEIQINPIQQKLLKVNLGDQIIINYFQPTPDCYLGELVININTFKKTDSGDYDTVLWIEEIIEQINKLNIYQIITIGQKWVVPYHNLFLQLNCLSLSPQNNQGMLVPETKIRICRSQNLMLKLTKKSRSSPSEELINNPYNLEKLGIGGLDKEFNQLFRRAFSSRIISKNLVEMCDIKHVKGIVLYGPPGTGKTLLARKIGSMLNCQKVTVVNGPELLNKFVGQSEENVRKLFREAENDYKTLGNSSPLHLIIIDEMDALCRKRGSGQGNPVHDSLVNQLLTKIDGIDSINNLLMIGMTNRLDLIDKALLRPGRFEIQIEIGLPDLNGRIQIIKIHTKSLVKNELMGSDISVDQLAHKMKNYTGAEIEGVVKNAVSYAIDRDLNQIQSDNCFQVSLNDFLESIKEINPAFGSPDSIEKLNEIYLPHGIINYGPSWDCTTNQFKIIIDKLQKKKSGKTTILIEGGNEVGKTALAIHLAIQINFPFIRLIKTSDLIGLSDIEKCQSILEIFNDANKSNYSIIIIDDLERLIDYTEYGSKFSNSILQTIISLVKKEIEPHRHLVIIGAATMPTINLFKELKKSFQIHINIPYLDKNNLILAIEQIKSITPDSSCHFNSSLAQLLTGKEIGIKKLFYLLDMINNSDHLLPINLTQIIDAIT